MSAPSLEQKIGQLIMLGFDGETLSKESCIADEIKQGFVGGVILFDYNLKTKKFGEKNIVSSEQLKKLTQDLQSCAVKAEMPKLFVAVDYEGGQVNRLHHRYGFPEIISAARSAERENFHEHCETMADVLAQHGLNINFAPVADLYFTDSVIGNKERCFHHDPDEVFKLTQKFIKAHNQRGIWCALKHFPGQGSAQGDTHHGFVDVSNYWQAMELTPYERMIEHTENYYMVMISHIINQNLEEKKFPATFSKTIVTDLLRKRLGFNGIVITDDLQMSAINGHYSETSIPAKAINAGADLLLYGNQLVDKPVTAKTIVNYIKQGLDNGTISHHRVDEAYHRIKAAKLNWPGCSEKHILQS